MAAGNREEEHVTGPDQDALPGLWLLRLPDPAEAPAEVGPGPDAPVRDSAPALALAELDPDERQRAAAFHRRIDRTRYAAAHIALRRLLAAATGREPGDLVFLREPCPCCGEPHGRPALADPPRPLHFSLSHGGDLVLVGIAATPIGVDVEPLPRASTVAELARVLHPAEQAELAELPPGAEVAGFARLWTRKEAYLKGIGTGLGRDPAEDYLGGAGRAPSPPGWTVTDLDLGPDSGHAAAVAVFESGPSAGSPPGPAPVPRLLPPSFVLAE